MRHFSFSSSKTRRVSVFELTETVQTKEGAVTPPSLFPSNAIPYASVTLPHARCRRCLSLCCVSLSFFVLPRILHLSQVPSPLPPIPPACLFFATHPYVDISLSIDPQGGIPPVALYRLLLYLSFLSIRSFLYTTRQPAFPSPPLLHSCCFSTFHPKPPAPLAYSIRRRLYRSILYRF